MKNNTQTLQESVRAQAYLLSEQAGHPPGMEKIFWFQAEAMVLGHRAALNGGSVSSKDGSRKTGVRREVNRARAQIKKKKTGGGKVLAAR